jgi:hypothetical protein
LIIDGLFSYEQIAMGARIRFTLLLEEFPGRIPACRLNYNSKGVEVNSSNRPIQVEEIYPAFIILLTGCVLAAFSFISE